ncbi:transaldolase [Duganella sp. Dugasp56]|uniref:transaldolase n=1 Tax=Duganella sp. Dugasp56 TaxID=3243046 RepID=UPI0039AFDB53
MNQLDQLKQYSVVVADTGDFLAMRTYAPRDATTNPSLILKAAQAPAYRPLLERVVEANQGLACSDLADHLLVAFGVEILRIVPGRVSTEVDARMAFDSAGTVEKGRALIARYEAAGIARDRVLIKIAATWEGIRAAEVLERDGIHCNMTLVFGLAQAAACAEAGVRLISPFVGRISDWYRQHTGLTYAADDDPGVLSVRRIFDYYARHGHRTEVMAASFRSTAQIAALAGCDLLTVSPELLGQLGESEAPLARRLDRAALDAEAIERVPVDEESFRRMLDGDAMASAKLAEGIRQFCDDTDRLERLIGAVAG